MTTVNSISQETDLYLLQSELDQLRRENARLVCAEREKELALEAVHQQEQMIETLTNERDYARMELQRATPYREKSQKLEKRIASVMAIAAVHHDQMGPYTKLALITGPEQVPYSAELHGGDAGTTLLSMSQWNKAICGVGDNTNAINRALSPVEVSNTVIRTEVNTGDGKTHWHVDFNENHLQHPRLISPSEPRPHNGGDKRCPQCHKFCKKKLAITYVCEPCGIDYDVNMKPIDHTKPAPLPPVVETPEPSNIIQFVAPELPIAPAARKCFQCHQMTRELDIIRGVWECKPCLDQVKAGAM